MKLQVNRGRTSGQQLNCVLVDSGGDTPGLSVRADEVGQQWVDETPHLPIAGTLSSRLSREATSGPALFGRRDFPARGGCVFQLLSFETGPSNYSGVVGRLSQFADCDM